MARGETWFSDGWIHCAFALVLYPAFCLFTLAAWRQRARRFPWLGFFILCIACLYCTALLYSPLAVLCRALILSSRPMAITLLWVAVQEGMGARDLLGGWLRSLRPCSSWPSTAPSIPSGLSGSLPDRWTRWSTPSCSSRPSP